MTKVAGWPNGANNIAPDYALPEGTARSIVNADVLDNGKLRRRKGFTALLEAAGIYGACSLGNSAGIAYVEGSDLKLRSEAGASTTLRSGLAIAPMTFYPHSGEVFFSNGTDTGKIVAGAAKDWGVETATAPPALAASAGALPAGLYQALCTFVTSSGEEGGCGRASAIVLGGANGLTLTPPAATSAEVTKTYFYLTPPDGDVFYYVGSTTSNAALALIEEPGYGPALKTQFLQKMPAGERIAQYKGRMYVAAGNIVWYSEPYLPGLCRVASSFMVFPADVTLMADVDDGLYVASDRLYFHAGMGPGDFVQKVALDCAVAAGSPGISPNSDAVVLYTARGLAVAKDGGIVEVFDKNVRADPATDAAVLVRESDSLRQYVGVSRLAPHSSGLVATDYMDAEVIRRSE